MKSSDIFHSPPLLPAVFGGKEQQVKLGTGAQLLTLALSQLLLPFASCFSASFLSERCKCSITGLAEGHEDSLASPLQKLSQRRWVL